MTLPLSLPQALTPGSERERALRAWCLQRRLVQGRENLGREALRPWRR